MRTELQAKFIQHLNNRKNGEKGFTLVELLVVIIIIGILAAIALPNFLSQGAKAKQTEAKQNIGLVNRIQTAYRSENASFASTFDILATGTLSGADTFQSKSYTYTITAGQDSAQVTVGTQDSALKRYHGGTIRFINEQSQSVITGLICEANAPASGNGDNLTLTPGASTATAAIKCATAYSSI